LLSLNGKNVIALHSNRLLAKQDGKVRQNYKKKELYAKKSANGVYGILNGVLGGF